jgi:hypothetical protein
VKWDAAAGASGRVDIGNVRKAVAAEKRNFTTGEAPVTFKAVGGEEQFLQRFKKKFKHYFASSRVYLAMRKISGIEPIASPWFLRKDNSASLRLYRRKYWLFAASPDRSQNSVFNSQALRSMKCYIPPGERRVKKRGRSPWRKRYIKAVDFLFQYAI